MRIYVLYFSDVYHCPNLKLTHKSGSDTGLVISSSILFPNNFVGGSWLIGLIRRPFSLVFPVEMKRKGCLFRNGNVSNPSFRGRVGADWPASGKWPAGAPRHSNVW